LPKKINGLAEIIKAKLQTPYQLVLPRRTMTFVSMNIKLNSSCVFPEVKPGTAKVNKLGNLFSIKFEKHFTQLRKT
jgi:hypothetical protein